MSIQLVVPMAGRGFRFYEQGFTVPKPLIDVMGKPMFVRVTENLNSPHIASKTFLILREHDAQFNLSQTIRKISGARYLHIDQVTEGAASTVCLAKPLLDLDQPLVVANSDQIVATDIQRFYAFCLESQADGVIMTMRASTPEWSFVKTNAEGNVTEVAEKKVISDEATIGIYFFRKAQFFFDAADDMFRANDRVNNEFYVAPTYNYMIARGQRILSFHIGDVQDKMFCLGTPEHFLRSIEHLTFKSCIDAQP